jgi:3,4-dihydroxy-9,10-secoandrosta-1,3,5(10)-triene-9,17-dione 4,5-dioxygenase
MTVRSLGYVVVEATDLGAWRRFAGEVLGLMEGAAGPDGSLRLRIDQRPFRIAVVPGKRDRFLCCGWEFRDAAELEAVIGTLKGAGVEVRRGSEAEAANRAVREIAYCADPCGNQLELFHGRTYDYAPFASPKGLSGFVAGELGMGHAVLPALELAKARKFYQLLGFADTDEMWLAMSPNPADPKLGIHFMHAACALDRCVAAGAHISSSLGKHSNDLMVSFYVQTPGGFDLEFGCDGLQPDWDSWVPTQSVIGDLWGHRWSPPPA